LIRAPIPNAKENFLIGALNTGVGKIGDFRLADISSSLYIGRYGGGRVADTLISLHTIIRFFCHYIRILPENPHYTSREYFN